MEPTGLDWLWSQRGLLLLGMSFTVGVVGYLAIRCWMLWRAARGWWDLFDAFSYSAFCVAVFTVATALETYSSPVLLTLGAVVIGSGWLGAWLFFEDTFNISGPR